MKTNRSDLTPYITKDGSEIRELLHPNHHPIHHQSIAEAIILPGQKTELHRHFKSEEVYFVMEGEGIMTLGEKLISIQTGDSILIPPGTSHCIETIGKHLLKILCCCSPAYRHDDTEIMVISDFENFCNS